MATDVLQGELKRIEPAFDLPDARAEGSPDEIRVLPLVSSVSPAEERCGTVRDPRLRVVNPFTVIYSNEEGLTVAEAPEFCEFGYGETRYEALIDLQRSLVELFFTLEEDQDQLGTDLQRTWEALQGSVERSPVAAGSE